MMPFIDFDNDFLDTEALLFLAGASGTAVEDTVTGNPLTFATNLAKPLKSLLIPFTPQQEGAGDPSPTNVRNIAPWDGLTVKHGGANLLLTAETIFGKWINGSGATSNDSRGAITSKIKVESSNVYTLAYNGVRPLSLAVVEYNESGTFVRRNYIDTDATGADEIIFTTSASTKTVVCEIYTLVGDMTETVLNSMKWQFEKGTRTDYGDTVTETDASFPSSVYGGTLDVVSGVLSVEYGIVSLGTLACYMPSDGMFAFDNNFTFGDRTKLVCNAYKTVVSSYWNTMANLTIMGSPASDKIFRIRDDDYADANTFKEHLTEIGAVLVYPLASPQTVQLTPAQITALVGKNTIWSDADGTMTAVYLKKP